MSLSALMSRPCVLIRRTEAVGGLGPFSPLTHDEYGNDIPAETLVQTVCEIQQAESSEPGDAGELSVAEWTAWFPTGTQLDTGDAVEVDGAHYEVVGAPWNANTGSSAVHHVRANLKKTAGAADIS